MGHADKMLSMRQLCGTVSSHKLTRFIKPNIFTMTLNNKLSYYNERSLMIITSSGRLKQLFVPFQVRCQQTVSIIKNNTLVYVDAVSEHPDHKIMYRILGEWLPYGSFHLVIKY